MKDVFLIEVINQNLRNLELGSQESRDVPIWSIIGFQQRNRQDSNALNIDTFCTQSVVSEPCIIGTEKVSRCWHNIKLL